MTARCAATTALVVMLALGAGADPRLERAAAAHPDDPELAWALVRTLAAEEPSADTVRQLEHFVARWPGRRPQALLLLGRQLSELGRPAEAIPWLERAVTEMPSSPAARFHLALALHAVGRVEEADPHLQAAARLAPELASEAALLRALGRLESEDPGEADALLRESIALAPDGDAAHGARMMLRLASGPESDRSGLHLHAYAGMQHDDNVRLDSGAVPGVEADGDFAGVWGSTLTWDVPLSFAFGETRAESFALSTGAIYESRDYVDIDDFDSQGVSGFASARWYPSDRAWLGVEGLHGRSFLDEEAYSSVTEVRPNVAWALGERAGVLRLWGGYRWVRYEQPPLFPSLERDGGGFGAGVEHDFEIPGLAGGRAGWHVDWRRTETDAETDVLGFQGDFDHDRYRGGLRGRLPLPASFVLHARASLAQERYAHDNLLDFLNRLFVGTGGVPRKRKDLLVDTRVALAYPLSRQVEVVLHWSFLDRISNSELYDYDRNSFGLAIKLRAF